MPPNFQIMLVCLSHLYQDLTAYNLNIKGKYRRWLRPPDPSTNHNNAIEKCLPDTGSWLLRCQIYMDWKQKPSSIMWIHGICKHVSKLEICAESQCVVAGAGKTILL